MEDIMKNAIRKTYFFLFILLISLTATANEELVVLNPVKNGVEDKVYSEKHPNFTLSTYNIAAGRVGKLDDIAQGITQLNSDVTAIIEIDKNTMRSGQVDQLNILKEQTGLYGEFAKTIDFDNGEYGVAWLSKYPIGRTEVIQIPSADEQVILYTAEIQIPGFDTPILFVNAHLDWYADPTLRVKQAYAINDYVLGNTNSIFENISSRIIILAGDFNAVPNDESIKELLKYWNLVEIDDLDTRTWPTDNPSVAIDHLFTFNAQHWNIESLNIPQDNKKYWSNLSDHLPVSASLKLLEQ